tara:strand:- start:81 stop:266 length:186 start_codon:yes stop_codon:yes gene_type:complete
MRVSAESTSLAISLALTMLLRVMCWLSDLILAYMRPSLLLPTTPEIAYEKAALLSGQSIHI